MLKRRGRAPKVEHNAAPVVEKAAPTVEAVDKPEASESVEPAIEDGQTVAEPDVPEVTEDAAPFVAPVDVQETPPPIPEPAPDPLPTVAQVMVGGFNIAEAQIIVEAERLMRDGPSGEVLPDPEPGYVVTSPRKNGFWRIGRCFSRKPTKLKLDELTEVEIAVLDDLIENGDKQVIAVHKVDR